MRGIAYTLLHRLYGLPYMDYPTFLQEFLSSRAFKKSEPPYK